MKILKKWALSTGLAIALAGLLPGIASAVPLQLALVLDGSGSVQTSGWQQQLAGYRDAFTTGSFYDDYVAPSPYDSLWVSAYQFNNTVTQEIGWTQITSNADATAFGNHFNTTEMVFVGGLTNTEGAIQVATNSLLTNGISGGKMVIDISTDGTPTACASHTNPSQQGTCDMGYDADALAAANAARDRNITINALGVGSVDQNFLRALVGINPADSPTGFFLMANSFNDFGGVIQQKLGREIKEVPEPASLALMGLGLAGIGFARRRNKKC